MAVNHVDIFAARDDADMAGGRCEGVVEGFFFAIPVVLCGLVGIAGCGVCVTVGVGLPVWGEEKSFCQMWKNTYLCNQNSKICMM